MPLVVKDRVQETSTTTGTGTLTLSGAVAGFQTFSGAIGNTNTTYYTIQNDNEWEVGIGTVGAGTLTRDTVLESSNSGSLVDFGVGAKLVFCTYPAEKSVDIDTPQTLTNKTISGAANTISNINLSSQVTGTLLVANGGTGGTTAQAARNNIAGATTSGQYLRGNGTNVVMSTIQAGDVPTLNQNTTGNAGTATTLQTARTINGTSFNGSANITTANWGTTRSITIGNTTRSVNGSGDYSWTLSDIGAGDVTLTGLQTLTNKTLESAILNNGYTEEVYAISDGASVNLDPNNGSIQTWTLGASRTPNQANWAAGQAITLMINDGSAYTITWTTLAVVWTGGTAPTLATSGYTVIELWKVGTTIYGALVGEVA